MALRGGFVFTEVTPCPKFSSPTVFECLDRNSHTPCSGDVEWRMALSSTGRQFPRCDGHWNERLIAQEGINQRYPEHAPSDFSELDAGEHWDEDY